MSGRGALGAPVLTAIIYGVIIVGGTCRAFLQPARTALSAQIVPRDLYPRAIAWRVTFLPLTRVRLAPSSKTSTLSPRISSRQ